MAEINLKKVQDNLPEKTDQGKIIRSRGGGGHTMKKAAKNISCRLFSIEPQDENPLAAKE